MRRAIKLNAGNNEPMLFRMQVVEGTRRVTHEMREARALQDGELMAALRAADREAAVLHQQLDRLTAWSDALASEKVRRAANRKARVVRRTDDA
jgi:hypothetical protein